MIPLIEETIENFIPAFESVLKQDLKDRFYKLL